MADIWVDQEKVQQSLAAFFEREKNDVSAFGATVNQTFEAFVFASVLSWYRGRGWKVDIVHPGANPPPNAPVRLKFNTRGRPSGYSYGRCEKDGIVVEVRHNLRIATEHHGDETWPAANVCLDVAVVEPHDLSKFKSNDYLENAKLVTFGEAKHMSAFAELVANFLGLVHEMAPQHLIAARPYIGPLRDRDHLAPFLYVSGFLWPTARGILNTIRRRDLDVDIYDHTSGEVFNYALATIPAPPRPSRATGKRGGSKKGSANKSATAPK